MTEPLVGSRLAHYEISALLGRGGMGEVWRATDTRLDREVALKVLPEEMAADPERLERFKREAKAVAALNHPNIVTIHSVEEAGDRHLLTMELVEGESLDGLLPADGFDPRRLLELAGQVAGALGTAHDAGITHRDLKPANVMVTGEGRVKLLDFGLAKLAADEVDQAETELLTNDGMVLGTTPYMSPEQAQGLPVDPRSDVFSLGILLYEMATGRRPFHGDNRAAVTSAILTEQPPPVTSVAVGLPNHLGRVVRRCLRKRPERRYTTATAVAQELEGLQEELSQGGTSAIVAGGKAAPDAAAPRTARGASLAPWLAAALAGATAAVLAWIAFRPTPQPPVLYSQLLPPTGFSFSTLDGPPALSPDGRHIAFLAVAPGERTQLFVQSLDELNSEPIAGTDGAQMPFWKSDSSSLAFFADGWLKRIRLPGGEPEELAPAEFATGGSWSTDGTILFMGGREHPALTVHEDEGDAVPVPDPYPGSSGDWFNFPHFLPDGRHYLFQLQDLDGENSGINVASLDRGGDARVLTRTTSNAVFVAPNRLLLLEDGALVSRFFDTDSLSLGGPPVRIVQGVAWDNYFSGGNFSVSDNGLLVYQPGPGAIGDTELVRVDRQGREVAVLGPRAEYYYPRLSADGKRIAVDITDIQATHGDLWVLEADGERRTLISREAVDESSPVWFPGDRELAFMGAPDIYRRDAAGALAVRPILTDSTYKEPKDISHDGRYLLYEIYTKRDSDIWVLDLESGEARLWLGDPETEQRDARFSPNGHWVAYKSEVAGTPQIQVRSFPEANEKFDVSIAGGQHPVWRRDGSELFYYSPGSEQIMAVAVEWADDRPEFGQPRALFPVTLRDGFDVFPDGQSFLVNRRVAKTTGEPLVLVQNWEELLH